MKKFSLLLLVLVCLLASCLLASCSDKKEAEDVGCNHEYDYWQVQLMPTCDEPGKMIRFCYHCQAPERQSIDPVGHNWVNPTCTSPMTCSTCFRMEGDPIAHTEIVLEAVKPVACQKPGLTEGKGCSVCGEVLVEQKVIEFHTPEVIPAVSETCTTNGLTEGSRCKDCKIILVEQSVVPAKHNFESIEGKAPSCDEAGYEESIVCKNCAFVEKEATPIDALGHDTEVTVPGTPSTCTVAGKSDVLTCKSCQKTFGGEALPLADHTFVNGTCTACPELDPNYIPPDGDES